MGVIQGNFSQVGRDSGVLEMKGYDSRIQHRVIESAATAVMKISTVASIPVAMTTLGYMVSMVSKCDTVRDYQSMAVGLLMVFMGSYAMSLTLLSLVYVAIVKESVDVGREKPAPVIKKEVRIVPMTTSGRNVKKADGSKWGGGG